LLPICSGPVPPIPCAWASPIVLANPRSLKKAMMARLVLSLLACSMQVLAASLVGSTGVEAPKQGSWLTMSRTWSTVLDTANSKDTPVTRVVKLLKNMQGTLQNEMDEDEALFKKLACWCNNNRYEKNAAITAATAKIAELKSTIDASTAKSSELKETIKTTEAEVAENKAALAEATAQRAKQAKEFHSTEKETIENIEQLKNAIRVLGSHIGAALPQFSISLLSVGSSRKDIPWSDDHESSEDRSFDDFMRHSGLHADAAAVPEATVESARFLQKEEPPLARVAAVAGWSSADTALVRSALKSATAFVQRKHGGEYMASYAPQSGEILGVLKQLKDEISAGLSDSQKEETESASTFNELRAAKTAEIENGESTAERKEDELANTNNALAEAKEDLDQTNSLLDADTKFMVNLGSTCKDADANFEKRKAARLGEIKAVSETIDILTSDDARDHMGATYSFLQTKASADNRRQRAAAVLRKAGGPDFSVLATSVELDSFGRVKKAIDDMIAQLKLQQTDEVKKSDWCKAELRSNEMDTMKSNSLKDELDVKVADLQSNIDKLTDELTQGKKDIAQLQLELQRASENRKQANMDFQKTIAEQVATQDVLKTALERLAKYYDSFAQTQSKGSAGHTQTPPVAQATYDKSAGASGVMSMIEKLIMEAKGLQKESQQGEKEDQAQYEALVADTNASVKALQKLIVTKSGEKAEATKENIETGADLKSTQADIEGLGKYDADLHGECDYVLNNFGTRQDARQQEIEALQQAKSILSGASAR